MKEQDEPYKLFQSWFLEAKNSEEKEPTAMSLATVDDIGQPSVRMVLLKGVDLGGFVFYTNLGSPKVQDIEKNPRVALCLHWKSLDKQIRIAGQSVPVSPEEADAYFVSRPLQSQIGAWASRQSEAMPHRLELEKRVAQFGLKFLGKDVPRPAFWSGFRVVPKRIEFWHQKPYRLHDRFRFDLDDQGNWQKTWLYP